MIPERRLMHRPARARMGRVYVRSSVTMRTCDDDRVYVQSRRSLDSTTVVEYRLLVTSVTQQRSPIAW